MVGDQGSAPPVVAQTRFSADGFWWWDSAEWRAAFSSDRLWRWDGQGWVPARPTTAGGSGTGIGLALGLIGGFVVILVLVSILVIVVLLTMGNQITNVFSNVTAALGYARATGGRFRSGARNTREVGPLKRLDPSVKRSLLCWTLAAALIACGRGGGAKGSANPPSPLTFPAATPA